MGTFIEQDLVPDPGEFAGINLKACIPEDHGDILGLPPGRQDHQQQQYNEV